MPRLMRGVARTAVIAGTATAVSNRVSRRQANRWSNQEQQAYQEQQAAPQQPPAPQQQAAPQQPDGPAPQPAPAAGGDYLAQLKELGELHSQGVLTDEEFAAEKAKILSSN